MKPQGQNNPSSNACIGRALGEAGRFVGCRAAPFPAAARLSGVSAVAVAFHVTSRRFSSSASWNACWTWPKSCLLSSPTARRVPCSPLKRRLGVTEGAAGSSVAGRGCRQPPKIRRDGQPARRAVPRLERSAYMAAATVKHVIRPARETGCKSPFTVSLQIFWQLPFIGGSHSQGLRGVATLLIPASEPGRRGSAVQPGVALRLLILLECHRDIGVGR